MARSGPLAERVTVTMPSELVAGIDRIEANRSRFIAEAVRHELQRRQRLELLRSLEAPHPDSAATAALGLADWAEALPEGDSDLLDPSAGEPLHWRPESGWQHAGSPEIKPGACPGAAWCWWIWSPPWAMSSAAPGPAWW